MRASPDNFLYFLKQIVTGRNGDDTPVSGGLLPGQGSTPSSAQSADGGIKVDQPIALAAVVNTTLAPAITDSTGGTTTTPNTFAVVTQPTFGWNGSTDPTAAEATAINAAFASITNTLAKIALRLNTASSASGAVTGIPAIVTPASGTTIGTFSFAVPRDYDEASDHLAVFLEANTANADSGITITGTATVAPIASQTGTAIVVSAKSAVTATAPFSTANLNVTQLVQVFAINLSGYGLKRNDIVSVALAFAGTLTGNGYVYEITRHYDSTVVSYNDTDATDNPSTSGIAGVTSTIQTGFGNPLR